MQKQNTLDGAHVDRRPDEARPHRPLFSTHPPHRRPHRAPAEDRRQVLGRSPLAEARGEALRPTRPARRRAPPQRSAQVPRGTTSMVVEALPRPRSRAAPRDPSGDSAADARGRALLEPRPTAPAAPRLPVVLEVDAADDGVVDEHRQHVVAEDALRLPGCRSRCGSGSRTCARRGRAPTPRGRTARAGPRPRCGAGAGHRGAATPAGAHPSTVTGSSSPGSSSSGWPARASRPSGGSSRRGRCRCRCRGRAPTIDTSCADAPRRAARRASRIAGGQHLLGQGVDALEPRAPGAHHIAPAEQRLEPALHVGPAPPRPAALVRVVLDLRSRAAARWRASSSSSHSSIGGFAAAHESRRPRA